MNELTDGSYHSKMSDASLAFWLVEDAKKFGDKPGYNNMLSAMRQAAKRLDPASTPWLPAVQVTEGESNE